MKKTDKKPSSLRTFIISLIFAIALWVVVGIVNNPDIHNTITSLPIHYIGRDALEEQGLTLIAPTEKLASSVTISGKRGDLLNRHDEIFINVDVSGISKQGEYSLKGATQINDNRISIVRENIGEIDIVVEEIAKKEIPVEINQTGTLKDKLVKTVPQISKISVSGARSEIEALNKAVATIDIAKLEENSTVYTEFKFCDEADTILTKAQTLTPAIDKIPVDLTLYNEKTLPVKLRLSDEFKGKYCVDYDNTQISKTSVTVGLLPDYEADCVYVDVNSISDESADFALICEEGMYIPDAISSIRITPKVLSLTSKHIDIPLRATNLGEGLSADFPETVTGVLISTPAGVDDSSLFLVIDLNGLDKGSHNVKAQITDDKAYIAEEIFVDVIIH